VPDRHQRLTTAALYLICDDRPDEFLESALRGGVDVLQLRWKDAPDGVLLAAARRFKSVCARHNALFVVNDRPDVAVAANADGVHVGQDDVDPADARAVVGPDRLVGLSTHSPAQIDAVPEAVDYIGVGPVYETPTKPGRAAVGLELVQYAARAASKPFFAIGGVSDANVEGVRRAGARRVAVVRALTDAADPGAAAAALRRALTGAGGRIAAA
jgi:thiamine-phosphate pyrophosphorylase